MRKTLIFLAASLAALMAVAAPQPPQVFGHVTVQARGTEASHVAAEHAKLVTPAADMHAAAGAGLHLAASSDAPRDPAWLPGLAAVGITVLAGAVWLGLRSSSDLARTLTWRT